MFWEVPQVTCHILAQGEGILLVTHQVYSFGRPYKVDS